MKFGSYDVHVIETGRFRLDGGAMFGVVPKTLWSRSNPSDNLNRIEMTMRSMVLQRGDRIAIIDTGVGTKVPEKMISIYDIDLSEHALNRALAGLGIAAEDVTDVILTHAHFDHIGGCTIRDGDRLALQFPNATHFLQKRHWEWAMKPSERDRASFLPENYLPIADAGKLHLLDGPEELWPGLRVEGVEGHTFGQQIVRLSQEGRSLLYCADLVPMRAHVPAPWIMGYDLQPYVTLREKQDILHRAATDGDILVFEHDPFVEAATVVETERGFSVGTDGSLEHVAAAEIVHG